MVVARSFVGFATTKCSLGAARAPGWGPGRTRDAPPPPRAGARRLSGGQRRGAASCPFPAAPGGQEGAEGAPRRPFAGREDGAHPEPAAKLSPCLSTPSRGRGTGAPRRGAVRGGGARVWLAGRCGLSESRTLLPACPRPLPALPGAARSAQGAGRAAAGCPAAISRRIDKTRWVREAGPELHTRPPPRVRIPPLPVFGGPGGTGRSPGGAEPHFGVLGMSRTSGPDPSPPKPHPFPDPFGEKRRAKRLQPWGDCQRKKRR